jgi:hypothetical protein
MRDIETIDGELRLLAAVRRTARELSGRTPSTELIDALLDERAALGEPGRETTAGCLDGAIDSVATRFTEAVGPWGYLKAAGGGGNNLTRNLARIER